MGRIAIMLIALVFPFSAAAQQVTVLAEYWADSGILPPEYAWETTVTITTDGKLTLRHCRGYKTEGTACKTRKAKVDAAHRGAILAAVSEGDLLAKPARQADLIPVGGGATGGKVHVDGKDVPLPAFPIEGDAPRVAAVLTAIEAAIPSRLHSRFFGNN